MEVHTTAMGVHRTAMDCRSAIEVGHRTALVLRMLPEARLFVAIHKRFGVCLSAAAHTYFAVANRYSVRRATEEHHKLAVAHRTSSVAANRLAPNSSMMLATAVCQAATMSAKRHVCPLHPNSSLSSQRLYHLDQPLQLQRIEHTPLIIANSFSFCLRLNETKIKNEFLFTYLFANGISLSILFSHVYFYSIPGRLSKLWPFS